MNYGVHPDPYAYTNLSVLKNRAGLRNAADLDRFETVMTAQRAEEPLPPGRLTVSHYRAIHRHLFQDVYSWAGKFRTVRIAKGNSMFCYPEHIAPQMSAPFDQLGQNGPMRDLPKARFAAKAASFLASLNAIQPWQPALVCRPPTPLQDCRPRYLLPLRAKRTAADRTRQGDSRARP